MLKFYIITLYNTILNFNILTIISIIIFFFSCIILLFMIIVGILDSIYRPNSPQYPFNIFFDLVCPCIIIILPLIYIVLFKKEGLTLYKSGVFFILLHTFLTIPLFHVWSNNRNWPPLKTTWRNPKIFVHISIGILYPFIFIIITNILRYLRFNNILDLSSVYDNLIYYLPAILCIIFCWETFFIWLLIFNYFLKNFNTLKRN